MRGKFGRLCFVILVAMVAAVALGLGATALAADVSVVEKDVDNDGSNDVVIDNGAMEVTIIPAAGGRIFGLKLAGGPNIVHERWGFASDHPGVLGVWAGWDLYRNSKYSYEIVQGSGDKAVVKVIADNDDLLHKVEKTFTIAEGSTTIKVDLHITNTTRKSYKNNGTAFLSFIQVTKDGKAPIVFLPAKEQDEYLEGLPLPFAAERDGWYKYDVARELTENWMAVYDPKSDVTVRLTATSPVPMKYASGIVAGNYVSLEAHYYLDWPKKTALDFGYELTLTKGIQDEGVRRLMAAAPAKTEEKAPEEPRETGYFPPGTEASGYIRDLMLIYSGWYNPPDIGTWTPEEALRYVAYVDTEGNVKDWFFDSFLFLGLQAQSGRAFDSAKRADACNKEDWQWYIDRLFVPGKQFAAFEEAITTAKKSINDPGYKAKVIVAIPNPIPVQEDFGDVDGDGVSENFSAKGGRKWELAYADRMKAVKWYVDQIVARWKAAGYKNLELLGFYWLHEAVDYSARSEEPTLKATGEYLHSLGLKYFWIPYFKSSGARQWKEYGFDVAFMQPNYFFSESVPKSRFQETVDFVKQYNMGIEIEGEGRFLASSARNWRERYREYLRAGVEYGYMKEAIHAYYQGAKALLSASYAKDPEVRSLYDDTYKFVKGTYTP